MYYRNTKKIGAELRGGAIQIMHSITRSLTFGHELKGKHLKGSEQKTDITRIILAAMFRINYRGLMAKAGKPGRRLLKYFQLLGDDVV